MAGTKKSRQLDVQAFLAQVEGGRALPDCRKNQIIYRQGDPADSVFYIRKGKAKITVASDQGKEAVIAVLGKGDFFGEGCLGGQKQRMATASALTDCAVMQIPKAEILRVIHDEPEFADLFILYMLARTAASRRISSISCSTQAKSAWRERCCCWLISARKKWSSPSQSWRK